MQVQFLVREQWSHMRQGNSAILSPNTARKTQHSQSKKKMNKNKILQKKEMFSHAREAAAESPILPSEFPGYEN